MGVLRPAGEGDLDALLLVQQEGAVLALSHIFPQDEHPFPRRAVRERWEGELADPDTNVYVVTDADGNVRGFAATRRDELLHFGTAVSTWGSGLARTAHDELLERLAGAGVGVARLRVFEENRRARRFYEKLGWSETGRRSNGSFPPHPVLLEYERSLAPKAPGRRAP